MRNQKKRIFATQFQQMKTKRAFIGLLGRRNQGKSSLANAIAGQEISIVSPTPGTTTDPVKKSMEIFGLGPVVLVDTAGIDDEGGLGEQRIRKSVEAIKTLDSALLVISEGVFEEPERQLVDLLRQYSVPFAIVHNKSDLMPLPVELRSTVEAFKVPVLECDSVSRTGIPAIIDAIVGITPKSAYQPELLVGDLVAPGDIVALVMPQDDEAPEGRLILPQVQVIRDLLDHHAVAVPLQPEELAGFLQQCRPTMVITDSQAFAAVSQIVPADIPLTSFSIILSRAKGNFELFLSGTRHIGELHDGDRILMMESCSHATSCGDIGRHKLPTLLQKQTGKNLRFEFVAALNPLPEDLGSYALAIQCGGCMVTRKQLQNRVMQVSELGIPISNYGMAIAFLTGIFDRVTEPFCKG